jgi:hypothetical protein
MANLTDSSDELAPDTPPADNPDEDVAEPLATDQPVEAEPPLTTDHLDESEPLTTDRLVESFEELITRGRAAGFRPLKVLAASYIKQGLDVFDGVMGAFEDGGKGKKK